MERNAKVGRPYINTKYSGGEYAGLRNKSGISAERAAQRSERLFYFFRAWGMKADSINLWGLDNPYMKHHARRTIWSAARRCKKSMSFELRKPVRLRGPELAALRTECYLRDNRQCVDCGKKLMLENGGWNNMHMAHIKSRGAGGGDTLDNVLTKCLECHIGKEHGGYKNGVKPVPSKIGQSWDK